MELLQLAKKYPKAWKQYYLSKQCEGFFADDDIREYWSYITDFMDKQGIKIYAYPNGKSWIYVIIGVFRIERGLKNRQQAETKAIQKAFEILEERIKRANT